MRRKTNDRYTRLDAIERYLVSHATRGCTTKELANEFGVSPDTIRRDLNLLESRGTGLLKQGRRYFIDHRRILHTLKISLDEAIALYLAARLLARHSDEHNPFVVSMLEKLSDTLQTKTSLIALHIRRTAETLRERPERPRYIKALNALGEAWASQRKVWMRYESPRVNETTNEIFYEITERTFAPYFLEPSSIEYACYVIGFDDKRRSIRTFKIERILDIKITNETYTIPSEFDPYRMLKSAWGIIWGDAGDTEDEGDTEIVLQFASTAVWRLKESIWHISQQIEDLPDGSCKFTVRVGSIAEIKPWIRRWGSAVEVIEPQALRDEMALEACELVNIYKNDGETR